MPNANEYSSTILGVKYVQAATKAEQMYRLLYKPCNPHAFKLNINRFRK